MNVGCILSYLNLLPISDVYKSSEQRRPITERIRLKDLKGLAKHNAKKLLKYLEMNRGKLPTEKLLARFSIQEGLRLRTVEGYYAYLVKTEQLNSL